MKDRIASTENLAITIWGELEPHIMKLGVDLHCVRVQETENNYAEFFG
jgi:6-pyruvoyltetrahydropterin/6-carboxytetrahydropterin synthase